VARDRVVETLNSLIETCRDGCAGYLAASTRVCDGDLRRMLGKFAHQREDFATELALFVEELGGRPTDHGTMAGAVHRGWIEITGGFLQRSAVEVLRECERAEAHCVKRYERALERSLPPRIDRLVSHQLACICEVADRLRNLTG